MTDAITCRDLRLRPSRAQPIIRSAHKFFPDEIGLARTTKPIREDYKFMS